MLGQVITDLPLPPLVVIHGLKGAGKGVIAAHLVESYGYHVVKFADPLKKMIAILLAEAGFSLGLQYRCIEGDLKEAPIAALSGKSVRFMMQTIGTRWRDLLSPQLWILIAVSRVQAHRATGVNVVMDDLRFPLEYSLIAPAAPRFWAVVRSRSPEASGGYATDAKELLSDGHPVDFRGKVVEAMASCLIAECGYAAHAPEHEFENDDFANHPIVALAGATPARIVSTLRNEFAEWMCEPWVCSWETTAFHISEMRMDHGLFHHVIQNDMEISDLRRAVDRVLVSM